MSGQGEEDDLAAAWGASLEQGEGAPAAAAAPEPTRVLNQAEIDSLLGFDMGEGDESERSGIRAIINSARGVCSRFGGLDDLFEGVGFDFDFEVGKGFSGLLHGPCDG